MVKQYGTNYMGSKRAICEKLVYCILSKAIITRPARLIDAFGGGGAITHCAARSGLFDEIIYNELNPDVFEFVKRSFNGENIEELKNIGFVTREEFKNPDTPFYKKLLFSFGGNMINYAFSPENEKKAHEEFENGGRIIIGHITSNIERAMRMSENKNRNIIFLNKDYRQIKYKKNDIVYFDPPYSNTHGYGSKKNNFNTGELLDFAAGLETENVFISEYEINDPRFKVIAKIPRRSTFSSSNNKLLKIEKIYKKENL